jgi:hypothetical protein
MKFTSFGHLFIPFVTKWALGAGEGPSVKKYLLALFAVYQVLKNRREIGIIGRLQTPFLMIDRSIPFNAGDRKRSIGGDLWIVKSADSVPW